ncbi:MAG: sulfatase-like hydrolase/transferase [Bryobacteraceae bacterium]
MNRRTFLSAALQPRRRPPNVVFILADDLGYSDLGCYGGVYHSPNLDRLASEGVRFTQFTVAGPICSPSRVGLTTGQFPSRHLIHSFLNSRAANRERGMRDWLDPAAPAVARAFQKAGYATGHFGKWHMGGGRDVGEAPLPQAYGFDESLASFEGLGDRILPPGNLSNQSEKLGRGEIRRVAKHEQTGIYVDRTIDFLDRHRDRPAYVHLWLNDVHDAFEPNPRTLAKYDGVSPNKYVRQYHAVVDDMDRDLGRLLTAIGRMGLEENTIVIFASDNGPTAWPRYYKEGLEPPGDAAGLRGRKWSLYEGGIREPFFIRWKGRIPAGRVNRETILTAVDMFPSICRLTGVDAAAASLDGEDMSAALAGRRKQRRKPIFWEYPRSKKDLRPGLEKDQSPNLAVRDGRWKLLINADGSRAELYDLERDLAESTNVAARNPSIARRLTRQLLAWRESLPVLT